MIVKGIIDGFIPIKTCLGSDGMIVLKTLLGSDGIDEDIVKFIPMKLAREVLSVRIMRILAEFEIAMLL